MVLETKKTVKKFGIRFDESGKAVVSVRELRELLTHVKSGKVFCEGELPSDQNYLLVENHSTDYYLFPVNKLEIWEKDGSFEKGDALYKIELVKRF